MIDGVGLNTIIEVIGTHPRLYLNEMSPSREYKSQQLLLSTEMVAFSVSNRFIKSQSYFNAASQMADILTIYRDSKYVISIPKLCVSS